MALVKFISGDGVEHEVEETSLAAEIMRQNGLHQVGGETPATTATEPDANAVPAPKDRSKMKKAELVAEAEELGVEVVPDSMTNKQIIAAIEAKLAETAEDDAAQDDE